VSSTVILGVFIVALQVAGIYLWLRRDSHTIETDIEERITIAREGSPVAKVAHSVAVPVAKTTSVAALSRSSSMKLTAQRVRSSGKFNGDLEVYIAYQIAAVFIGSLVASLGFLVSGTALPLLAALLGAYIALFPHQTVKTAAKKAEDEAAESIPEFADLLQIGLAGAMTITNAMRFAAESLPDNRLVHDNVLWLVDTIERGSMTTEEAFSEAGRRIGSPEAAALFATLGRGSVSGAAVSETVARQAKNLRALRFQKRRERIKKIPVKMIGAFAVFFLPVLLAVLLLPVLFSLGNLT
jgi:Flp pilus assembly protein TadB